MSVFVNFLSYQNLQYLQSIEPAERRTSPPGLLRLSVGLEDVEDLKLDLGRALKIATEACQHQVVY